MTAGETFRCASCEKTALIETTDGRLYCSQCRIFWGSGNTETKLWRAIREFINDTPEPELRREVVKRGLMDSAEAETVSRTPLAATFEQHILSLSPEDATRLMHNAEVERHQRRMELTFAAQAIIDEANEVSTDPERWGRLQVKRQRFRDACAIGRETIQQRNRNERKDDSDG